MANTNKSKQPLFKENVGGISVAAWANGLVVQKRKPKDTNNPKGEWFTESELRLNKTQAQALRKMLKSADQFVEPPKPFTGKPAQTTATNDEDDD